MLAGKPDAGNPHVRFDEGEQRDWRKPPVALYSTGYIFLFRIYRKAAKFAKWRKGRMPNWKILHRFAFLCALGGYFCFVSEPQARLFFPDAEQYGDCARGAVGRAIDGG